MLHIHDQHLNNTSIYEILFYSTMLDAGDPDDSIDMECYLELLDMLEHCCTYDQHPNTAGIYESDPDTKILYVLDGESIILFKR